MTGNGLIFVLVILAFPTAMGAIVLIAVRGSKDRRPKKLRPTMQRSAAKTKQRRLAWILGALGGLAPYASMRGSVTTMGHSVTLFDIAIGFGLWFGIGYGIGWVIWVRPQRGLGAQEHNTVGLGEPLSRQPRTGSPRRAKQSRPPAAEALRRSSGSKASTKAEGAAARADVAESLRQLKALHDEGILTDDEYESKRKTLTEQL